MLQIRNKVKVTNEEQICYDQGMRKEYVTNKNKGKVANVERIC